MHLLDANVELALDIMNIPYFYAQKEKRKLDKI